METLHLPDLFCYNGLHVVLSFLKRDEGESLVPEVSLLDSHHGQHNSEKELSPTVPLFYLVNSVIQHYQPWPLRSWGNYTLI